MHLLLAVLLTLIHPALSLLSTVVQAQVTEERATFDVASIKINRSGSEHPTIRLHPSGLNATNATALDLIEFAFGILQREVIGELPGWARTTRFVTARAESGPLRRSRLLAMAVLACR